MTEPLTVLPLFEAALWESAWAAEVEGDHDESVSLAADLSGLGYDVGWEPKHMWLRHRGTGQALWWQTVPAPAWRPWLRLIRRVVA